MASLFGGDWFLGVMLAISLGATSYPLHMRLKKTMILATSRFVCTAGMYRQHVCLVVHRHWNSPWYREVTADLHMVCPDIRLCIGEGPHGTFMHSVDGWADGQWWGAQALAISRDMLGRRAVHDTITRSALASAISGHIRYTCSAFQLQLRRQHQSRMFERI